MEKPILITATSLDEQTYEPVTRILNERGFSTIIYKTDKVLANQEQLCIEITENGKLKIDYNNQSIAPNDISAAWYRKIAAFSSGDDMQHRAKNMYVHNEIKTLHDSIWSVYPDDLWLNSPEKIRHADKKLGQLLLASELGFSTPQTIISNQWEWVRSKLLIDNNQIVVKMLRGVISDNDKLKALFTKPLDEVQVQKLKEYTNPFPGIYQPFLQKFREWRVTVVGDNVFPAAIYTDETAKDDWRKLQLTDSVQFVKEDLPTGIDEKCLQFLGKMGLKFGAFDLIETSPGDVIFLECNSNGQYGWLEETLHLPISLAIADELVKISKQGN